MDTRTIKIVNVIIQDGLERSNGTAKTRSRVDIATTTTCPRGVTRGEGSSDGGAVMSTPTIAESSAGLALTHQHHPHAIITNPVQVARSLWSNYNLPRSPEPLRTSSSCCFCYSSWGLFMAPCL